MVKSGMDSKKIAQCHGVLVLNKPKGPSSTSCIERIKRKFKQKKIGHAGTLDPMASGVLVVLLGKATKLAPYLMEGHKVYRGVIRLGIETDTYDITGNVLKESSYLGLTEDEIVKAIYEWQNIKEQEVPPYSAAKHKGKTFYSMARQGERPPKRVKKIYIDQVEVLGVNLPFIEFRIRCSKGTYVRSLAHSLGKRLKVGGVLFSLIRERAEPYGLEHSVSMEELLNSPSLFFEKVIDLSESLPHWPKLAVDEDISNKIKNGNLIRVGEIGGAYPEKEGERYLFLDPSLRALAIMETRFIDGTLYWKILRGLWGRE